MVRYVDLFAGIGGFRPNRGECVAAIEYDPVAVDIYNRAHRTKISTNDITEIQSLPEHDLAVAGFPCQPFSKAGRQHALNDPRGSLYKHIFRLSKSPIILLENVPNIINMQGGAVWAEIKSFIQAQGYRVHVASISAEHWVPQKRRRVFIICLKDNDNYDVGKIRIPYGNRPPVSTILEPNIPADPKYIYADYTMPWEQTKTLTASYPKEPRNILVHPGRPLTVNEGKRLMGFPDTFPLPENRTVAFRLLGNSIVPQMAQAVIDSVMG